jgi:hypothetical protein
MALDWLGDKQAVPVLLECLKEAGKTVEYRDGYFLPDKFIRPVEALTGMKAYEATED